MHEVLTVFEIFLFLPCGLPPFVIDVLHCHAAVVLARLILWEHPLTMGETLKKVLVVPSDVYRNHVTICILYRFVFKLEVEFYVALNFVWNNANFSIKPVQFLFALWL